MNDPCKLSNEELSVLCEQLALILRGGLPIQDGVEALGETYKDTRYAESFARLNDAVLESGSLTEGFRAAGAFPGYFLEMTSIGEKTGELDGVMEGLAQYYGNEARHRRAIRSAVFYPLLLIVMMAVLVGVLIAQVLPVFEDVFASFSGGGADTWMSLAMRAGKIVLFVAAAAIFLTLGTLAALRLDRSGGLRRALTRAFKPLRRLEQKLCAARFSASLAMTLRSGYPLDQSLELMQGLFPEGAMREKMERCLQSVQEGRDFTQAVEELQIFEPLHCRMIRMGFRAGQTDRVMGKLAELYAEELDNQINRLVAFIEPSLVALMALIVGAILLAVMLPLLSVLGSI